MIHTACVQRVLLERDRELSVLGGLIGAAVAGDPSVCVVEGPPGIGKSRLVAEVRARAGTSGAAVLSASANELERDFGFGVVGQLFEPAVRRDHERLLSGAAAPARLIVGPEGRHQPDDPVTDPSFASLHGLYWLTVRLTERQPVLLAIDDLQWCDTPSLRFLAYLRARLEGLPILIVCSVRAAEPGVDAAALAAVLADPSTVRIRPRALSETATSVLIEQRLAAIPEPAFTTACHRATGGNPLLLEQLVSALADEDASPDAAHLSLLEDLGPGSVARTLFLRLGRLGPDATAVAQALAVLGDGCDLAAVAALAGLDVDRAGRATAALARAEIVRAEPPLGFVHPLVAAAVYRDVLPGDRERRHLRAAELLARSSAPAEQVAGHLLHAPAHGAAWVVDSLVRAAAVTTRKGATESAVSYLERALAEPPGPERRSTIVLTLGRAEMLRNGAAAVEHLRTAYSSVDDPEQRAIAAEMLGRVLLFTGDADDAVRVVQDAAAALPAHLDGLRQRLEAFELYCLAGEPEALRRLERYRTRPVAAGLGAKMLAAIAAQAWMHACGPSDAISELSLEALSGGELIAADTGWAATFAITNLSLADREDAENWWELARTQAYRHGSLLVIPAITLWHATALQLRGELADAEQSVRECLTVVDQWGFEEQVHARCYSRLASVLRDRGDLRSARRALDDTRDTGGSDDSTRCRLGSQLELLLAERSFEQAIVAADDYARRFDHIVRNPFDVPWRSLKALALDQLGRREEALELLAAELELARAWGAPSTVARTLRALGTVEREDGIGYLEEAAAVVAGSPARLEHARSLTALGAALRRARRPAQARTPLREALDIASACGAELVAEQARTELYAAGGRPRRTALTGAGALTASERRVVERAAEGATNREIGEALFVTPKTVAMHLSNAYRKLGVASRRDLATALQPG